MINGGFIIYNWIQSGHMYCFRFFWEHLHVRFGWFLAVSPCKVFKAAAKTKEEIRMDQERVRWCPSMSIMHSNWLAFRLPKYDVVPNELRDPFDRKNVSIFKVSQGVFCGRHSSIHSCSLKGKGDDRSSKGEGQGDSNRFSRSFCHGILHDFRRTK